MNLADRPLVKKIQEFIKQETGIDIKPHSCFSIVQSVESKLAAIRGTRIKALEKEASELGYRIVKTEGVDIIHWYLANIPKTSIITFDPSRVTCNYCKSEFKLKC